MFLSKTLHTELLKAAEQNGVNKMLTWGGVGAGVGGAYVCFQTQVLLWKVLLKVLFLVEVQLLV